MKTLGIVWASDRVDIWDLTSSWFHYHFLLEFLCVVFFLVIKLKTSSTFHFSCHLWHERMKASSQISVLEMFRGNSLSIWILCSLHSNCCMQENRCLRCLGWITHTDRESKGESGRCGKRWGAWMVSYNWSRLAWVISHTSTHAAACSRC